MAEITETLDGDADLHLIVGRDLMEAKTTKISVCSKTVARISPVLRIMLRGNFHESKSNQAGDEDWVVELPEDDPSAMLVLMSIAHSDFQRVPSSPHVKEVYGILVVAEKYDMLRTLQP